MPKYVDGMCAGYSHKFCEGEVLLRVDPKTQRRHRVPCECSCHGGAIPQALEVSVQKSDRAREKALAFAKSQGLKGTALQDFMKGAGFAD